MEGRKTHPNDYINPMNFEYSGEIDGVPSLNTILSFGLTKREYYAGLAMQGLLSSWTLDKDTVIDTSILADDAIKCADALINGLNK